jgi:hypothetical protein
MHACGNRRHVRKQPEERMASTFFSIGVEGETTGGGGGGGVQPATRADGAEVTRVRAWEAARGATAAVAEAEAAVARGETGAACRLERAREALQDILDEATLEAADEGNNDMFDDFDESADDSDSERVSPRAPRIDDNNGGRRGTGAATTTVSTHEEEEQDPPNFSRVDLSLPSTALARRFPLFPGLSSAAVCEVRLRATHIQPACIATRLSKPSSMLDTAGECWGDAVSASGVVPRGDVVRWAALRRSPGVQLLDASTGPPAPDRRLLDALQELVLARAMGTL